MRIEEFAAEQEWWGSEADGFAARVESEFAWKVPLAEVRARGWSLDIKNPHRDEQMSLDPDALLAEYRQMQVEIDSMREQLKAALGLALRGQA